MAEISEAVNVPTRRDFLKMGGMAFGGLFLRRDRINFTDVFQQSANAKLDFFFVNHLQAKDLGGFDEELKQSDVFVPELIGWSRQDEKYFNDVSQGVISAEQIQTDCQDPYRQALLLKLRGSEKLVKFIDAPAGSMLEAEFYEMENATAPNYAQPFGDHVRTLFTQLEAEASWHRDREDYILFQLQNLTAELRKDNPQKYSGKINILLEYGFYHTRLLHLMEKQGADVDIHSRYPAKQARFLNRDEAKRRYAFAQDTKDPKNVPLPDANQVSTITMEDMLMNWFFIPNLPSFENSAAAISWIRDVAGRFSTQEVYDIWEFQRTARQGKKILSTVPPQELRGLLASKLQEKGVAQSYINAGLASETTPNPLARYIPTRKNIHGIETA